MLFNRQGERGALSADLAVAMFILVVAVLPIAFSFTQEQRVLAGYYQQALVSEIIDGELEVLSAGEWRAYRAGSQDYEVKAASVKNLGRGRFTFTVEGKVLRLEWAPERGTRGSRVRREVKLQ